jgi:penicillin-binding protein 2
MSRRLFSSRRNDYGGSRYGGNEMRNTEREVFLFRRRLVIAALLALGAFGALFGRFVYLQVVQHDHYRMLAESNRVAIVPIVPNRGVITDRKGVVLAQSYSAYTLELTPAKIRNLEATIDELATIVDIQPRDRKRFRKLLDESKNFESMPLRTRLSDEEVARFAVNRYRFPGVDIKARLFRQYPFGEVASHVIGYIGRITDKDLERIASWEDTANYKGSDYIGKVGVELSYERELHGTTGVEEVEVDAGGRAVRTLSRTPPVSGNNLRLSLDIRLQEVAEQAFGDRRGALVAIEPATGDILAFVSKPGYDPNLFVEGIDAANWEALNESPDKPLLNRPLRGAYPPGSTIKPFLALGALTSGKRTPQYSINDPGFFQLPGSSYRFRDDKPGGHGSVDMYKSIVVSCDTYYYILASDTDIDDTARFMTQLGFGRKTGVDIEGELTGVLPSREWKRTRFAGEKYRDEHRKWYLGDSISAGIGQGYNAFTPMQARQCHLDRRQRRRRLQAAPGQEHREPEDRRGALGGPRADAYAHLQARAHRHHQERARRREQGRHQRHRFPRRRVHLGRQDRHGAGVFAQGREVRPQQGRRAPARSRVVRRVRTGRQAEDRARGAGGKRRLRRAGGGAHRAQGPRVLPPRQDRPRARDHRAGTTRRGRH